MKIYLYACKPQFYFTVLPTRPKNGEISAQASLAALSPLIIKSNLMALLKTIKSLIKLYQMSTFPLNSIWSCMYLLVQKIFSWYTEFIINLFQFHSYCVCFFFFFFFFFFVVVVFFSLVILCDLHHENIPI